MKKQSIKKLVMLFTLVTILASCNQGATLQTYFVDNQERPDFLSVDVPAKMLNLDESQFTEEQLRAYNSIQKLNMLAFSKTTKNDSTYTKELAQVKTILKNPKYEELMRGGNSKDGKFVIKYIGEGETIDELILFGNAKNKGFAVIRVLGDEMNPSEIIKLQSALEKVKFDDANLKQFQDFFK